MHMADALISPVVGGIMLATTTGVVAYSIKKIQNDMDEKKIPLMGVMGAFIFAASMISALIGLQTGAFSVVMETLLSGKTELPFGTFVLMMQPIHLAIGVVEGFVTATIITFIWKARPEIIEKAATLEPLGNISIKKVLTSILIAVFVVVGSLSWFASTNLDGLEWSMKKTSINA